MDADLSVSMDDPTPPYEQLRRQLFVLISTRALPPGTRLPPLRQLAGDLGLAVGTVARTYRELESAGLIHSRRGAGTRVAQRLPADAATDASAHLTSIVTSAVIQALALGSTPELIRRIVDDVLHGASTRVRQASGGTTTGGKPTTPPAAAHRGIG